MGRPVVLSNGSLFVGLNEQGLVHDFYYPYVGLDNLTTARSVHHKIGVWVGGIFSWVDDEGWLIHVNFSSDALISHITMKNEELGVTLDFRDFVDHEFDAFCRKITVRNDAGVKRDIRLFMHQVFQISRAGRADTALYEPDGNYIYDYKGRCGLLIYGQTGPNKPFKQYSVGNYGIEGKEGTFRDAEDGELSYNTVEHGGVDSVLGLEETVEAHETMQVEYWIVASDVQYSANQIHERLLEETLDGRLDANRQFWKDWFRPTQPMFEKIPHEYHTAVQKSLLLIKAHSDKRGGIIASGDSSIYNYGRDYYSYVWPRDGALAVWPLIRMGLYDEAKALFEFCRDVMHPEGYMMHKYQPDRSIGSTWHPLLHKNHEELAIQEDETAILLFMLGEYYQHSKDATFIHKMYDTFIKPTAQFMASYIDEATGLPHASYDLWEQKFLTTTYSVAVTYQALLVASDLAHLEERADDTQKWKKAAEDILRNSDKLLLPDDSNIYSKGFYFNKDGTLEYDTVLDVSSMYGVMMFGLHNETIKPLLDTVKAIEDQLLNKTPSDGVPRYTDDNYFASRPSYHGNPWHITTLWMAQFYSRTEQIDRAKHYLDWSISHAYDSGVLSEQVNPTDGTAVSVAPLVWSHAELINTVLDYTSAIKNSPSRGLLALLK